MKIVVGTGNWEPFNKLRVPLVSNFVDLKDRFESGPMSSLEAGPHGTFIGIYDGHGGPEAAQFVDNHLFENLKSMYTMSLISECIYLSDSKNSSNFKFAE
ncbi:hypothetical protein Dimus_003690 [Dionaea muscipula]